MIKEQLKYEHHELLVSYEIYPAEPDVWIMHNYPEIDSIKLLYKERERELPLDDLSHPIYQFIYDTIEV